MRTNPNNLSKRVLLEDANSVKSTLNDYFAAKVIDWAFKNKVDEGKPSEFIWDPDDKKLLTKIFDNPKLLGLNLPMRDSKFKIFIQSIIKNGLNTADVGMFQRYKDKLPLRALGLSYEKEDFNFSNHKIISQKKIISGFYMVELTVTPKDNCSTMFLDLFAHHHEKLSLAESYRMVFKLNAKTGTMAKRLIWIENDAYIEIQRRSPSSDHLNKSEVLHLKLARLTKSFFVSRMFKKLGKKFDVNKDAKISNELLIKYWKQYDYIFQSLNFKKNNIQDHDGIDKLIVPTQKEQVKRILNLLASNR